MTSSTPEPAVYDPESPNDCHEHRSTTPCLACFEAAVPAPEPTCARCEGSKRVCRGCDNAVHGGAPEAHRHMWQDHDGIPTDCGPVVMCPDCPPAEAPAPAAPSLEAAAKLLYEWAPESLGAECEEFNAAVATLHAAARVPGGAAGEALEALFLAGEVAKLAVDNVPQPRLWVYGSSEATHLAQDLFAAAARAPGPVGGEAEALFEDAFEAANWLGTPTIEDGEGPNRAADAINRVVNRLAVLTGRMVAPAEPGGG